LLDQELQLFLGDVSEEITGDESRSILTIVLGCGTAARPTPPAPPRGA
jgi:hypothetical protein